MDEYIERKAALNIVNGWRDQLIPTYEKNDEYVKCLETVAEHLESLHAADVRPVVYCRDCKYAPSGTDGGEDQGFSLEWPHDEWPEDNPCPCKCEDGWYSHKPKPDFFCANGKREES